MDGFDVQSIGYVAPAIITDWKIANADMGPVFSAGLLGLFLGSIVFSMLADRNRAPAGRARRNARLLDVDAADGARHFDLRAPDTSRARGPWARCDPSERDGAHWRVQSATASHQDDDDRDERVHDRRDDRRLSVGVADSAPRMALGVRGRRRHSPRDSDSDGDVAT
jgi:hypothetical protein